jgi:hypothetical protein
VDRQSDDSAAVASTAAPRADGGSKPRHDADLRRDGHQILHAHDLRNSRGHLGHDSRRRLREHFTRRFVGQSHSRNSPTVSWAMGSNAASSCASKIRRVTSSDS